MKDLFYGICAGILIGIGGAVFLASENRVIGAILFSVALICICAKGYSLYTGKVGYLAFSHRASDLKNLAFCFLGNSAGGLLFPVLSLFAEPHKNTQGEAK